MNDKLTWAAVRDMALAAGYELTRRQSYLAGSREREKVWWVSIEVPGSAGGYSQSTVSKARTPEIGLSLIQYMNTKL